MFKWKETLNLGTKANAIVIKIINNQLIYLFFFMAFMYFQFPQELLNSKIGNVILIGYSGFWIFRLIQQFIFLKMKGSFVIKLTILFFIGAIIHLLPIIV